MLLSFSHFLQHRGGATNQHEGNIRFRKLVAKHKLEYMTTAKSDKPRIVTQVIDTWRGTNPPGRFLQKTNPELGDETLWHDVGEAEARKKAAQCLREKTPDIAPILKKLQEEQEIEEEKIKKKAAASPKRESKHKNQSTNKELPPSKEKAKDGKPKKKKKPQVAKREPEHVATHGYARLASDSSLSPMNSTLFDVPEKQASPVPSSAAAERVGPRLSLVKEKKSRNIREEVSRSLPTAASLVKDTSFGTVESEESSKDLGSSGSFSLLPPDLKELMQASSIGNMSDSLGSFPDSTISGNGMDNLSTSTWFKSFQSLENSSSRTPSNRTMMSIAGTSLQGIREEQSGDMEESITDALDLAFPLHDEFENRTANLQKLTWARSQVSNFSLLSDLTGDSSHHRRRMMNARIDSEKSTTSSLTDAMSLSDSLKGMDLAM